jgi:hypothetical protein
MLIMPKKLSVVAEINIAPLCHSLCLFCFHIPPGEIFYLYLILLLSHNHSQHVVRSSAVSQRSMFTIVIKFFQTIGLYLSLQMLEKSLQETDPDVYEIMVIYGLLYWKHKI